LDIPDLFSHVKDMMKSQAEVTEENPEKETESQMTVIVDKCSINESQMTAIVLTCFINKPQMMVIGRVGLA